ncbi:hypothetical protein GCM10009760_56210 [Kitasatospora kazusensis]|uniref:Uncharacterized protein n=1 Tax=Kitasatospora kazusensis TaxID=407974 RepID=A0ABP5M1J3_9ACTN
MYSYDVAAAHRPPTSSRSIPGMRPSYDAEHPSPATPIYDALYSEYRRLFRALPGDRSGEEDMRFTGFAVRDSYLSRELYPARAVEAAGYPQQQAFHTYPGHAQGTPQFMPAQQQLQNGGQATNGHTQNGQTPNGQYSGAPLSGGQGWVATGYLTPPPPAPQATAAAADDGGAGMGGRHRSMLSLPPGRVPGQG